MTISNQPGRKAELSTNLPSRLENIGAREIGIWKEMVLQDDSLFTEVYCLIYCANPKLAWHAAWVIDHASEANPCKLEEFVPEIIERLPKLQSSSLKRHFTRMLTSQKIPENQMGLLVDVLYNLLSPSEAIAVRANALQLLYNIALVEPALQPELRSVAEAILEEEQSPGMISKARSVIGLLKSH
jgi:hypothetical protein